MTPFDWVLLSCAVVLSISAVSVVVRMVIGPTILDRAVATDVLVVLVVCGMGLHTARTGEGWAVSAMLALTGLAFIGTVAFARFVAREHPGIRAGSGPHRHEPDNMTGPLEAVHLDRAPTGEGRR